MSSIELSDVTVGRVVSAGANYTLDRTLDDELRRAHRHSAGVAVGQSVHSSRLVTEQPCLTLLSKY